MRRKSAALALIVIALAAAGGWWWKSKMPVNGGSGGSETASAGPAGSASSAARGGAQSVGVIQAVKQDVPVTLEASGTVASLSSVDLRAQTTSTVREVLIRDGDQVRKGQPLLRFDDRADRANLDKARAQLTRDRASLADAERQFARAQDLRAQNFIAQSALDTALAAVEGQRALVGADDAALQAASVALSYNELRAPFAGRAGAVSVFPGSLVQASSATAALVNIAQIDPIGVNFVVPETQLQALLTATRQVQGRDKPAALEARIMLPGAPESRTARADGDAVLSGLVRFVDNLVDAGTGTIKVRAEFENSRQTLWPGQYVRVKMTLRTLKDAVVIPQAALILRGTERSVYVVDAERKAQLKRVQLRYAFGEMAVVEGIEAGDKVVVDGKQNLRPGGLVREQAASLNPAAAPKRAAPAASSSSSSSSSPSASGAGA